MSRLQIFDVVELDVLVKEFVFIWISHNFSIS